MLSSSVKTGYRVHLAPYRMTIWDSFLGIKQLERKAEQLPPSNAKFYTSFSYTLGMLPHSYSQ